jgi:hypothetical protein
MEQVRESRNGLLLFWYVRKKERDGVWFTVNYSKQNILYNVGGIWPVLLANYTGYATEDAVRIVDSFISIPITRSYNHTQLLLTLLHVTLLTLLLLTSSSVTLTYCCRLNFFTLWLTLTSSSLCLLPSHCLKKGLAGPKWEHLPLLFIYAL